MMANVGTANTLTPPVLTRGVGWGCQRHTTMSSYMRRMHTASPRTSIQYSVRRSEYCFALDPKPWSMSALPCSTTTVFHLFCGMWRRSRTALGELTENRIIAAARSARRAQVRGICAAGGCGGCGEARQVSGATGRQGIGGGVWLLVGGPRESGDERGGCTSGFLHHRYTISCLANLLLASTIKAERNKAGQGKVREHKLLQ